MAGAEVENHLNSVLKQAAEELKLTKYTLNLNPNVERGDGFSGEFFKASIVDEETNKEYHVVLKKAPSHPMQRQMQPIEVIYKNETALYSEVLPALKKLEAENSVPNPFTSVPGYITSCNEIEKEVIVLNDITFEGFELRKRDLLLDDEHIRLIFKIYGHFHSLSFCFKEKKPEVYQEFSKKFLDFSQMMFNNDFIKMLFHQLTKECYDYLDPIQHAEVRERFQKYVEKPLEIFMESFKYPGNYSGIIHGDCWTNNMMFKYQDSKLQDAKIFDFQLTRFGTPVYDLSYFLYTGGSKALFDNLESYLDVYHQSFSESARNMGCDPDKLLPRSVLSEEWKKHARYGMIAALFLTRTKLMSKEVSVELVDVMADQAHLLAAAGPPDMSDMAGMFDKFQKYDKEVFKKRVLDILTHSNEIGIL